MGAESSGGRGGASAAPRRPAGDVPRPDPGLPVPEGLVVVDKPQGWTSHDVVGRLRRLCGTRKVGHAGTLDPLATGVLVVGVGRGTRLLTHLVGADKQYLATLRLGAATITDDAEGEVLAAAEPSAVAAVTDDQVRAGVERLTGRIEQVPSAVSAVKVDGRRSYARVRAGETVQLPPRPVTVSRFDVLELRRQEGAIEVDAVVEVSSGTYVRALARDLGEALGIGGHLTALRRTRVGALGLDRAHELGRLQEIVARGGTVPCTSLDDAARAMFAVRELSAEEALAIGRGQRIGPTGGGPSGEPGSRAGLTAGFDPDGHVVALLEDRGGAERRHAASVLVFQAQG